MNRSFVHFVGLAVLATVLVSMTGCGPASPPVTYHSLLGSDLSPQTAAKSSRLAILIGPVSVPDVLKSSQIATGSAGEHYQRSDQHRWAGELDRDFARAIGEQLATRLGTEQVALYPMGQHLEPTWQVVLDILALEGLPGREAKLVVRWSLVDPKNKTTKLTRRSGFSEQPAGSGYDAWVAAQRRNIDRLGEEIAAAITTNP